MRSRQGGGKGAGGVSRQLERRRRLTRRLPEDSRLCRSLGLAGELTARSPRPSDASALTPKWLEIAETVSLAEVRPLLVSNWQSALSKERVLKATGACLRWGGGSSAKGRDLLLSNNVRHGWSVKTLFGKLDAQVAVGEGAEGRCATSAWPHVRRRRAKPRRRQGARRGWEQRRQEQQWTVS